MSNKKIMLGNEAIARGAYEAGVKVTSAYPGTPSTEVSENVVKYKEIYATKYVCVRKISKIYKKKSKHKKLC